MFHSTVNVMKLNNLQHKKEINTTTNHETIQNFHPRVVNLTDITFNNNENTLLQKVLKYNLHIKPKNWIKTIALEAETANQSLPIEERNPIRYLVAKSLDKLPHKHPYHTTANEHRTLRSIRDKLIQNNCMITKADKGQTLIVITKDAYESKIYNFLQDNKFIQTPRDPTAFYTRETELL